MDTTDDLQVLTAHATRLANELEDTRALLNDTVRAIHAHGVDPGTLAQMTGLPADTVRGIMHTQDGFYGRLTDAGLIPGPFAG